MLGVFVCIIAVALMYGEYAKFPRDTGYEFNTVPDEVLGDGLLGMGGIWNGGTDFVDDFVALPCSASNCFTEIIPCCACAPLPLGLDFDGAAAFDFSSDGWAPNPGGTNEQNCSYCERKLLGLVVAVDRINSIYFEIKSFVFVTPAMPRPPNEKLLVVAFFFGLFVLAAFSGCIGTTGVKLGIGLFGIPLGVGMMLNDFGKSCGKCDLAVDKSVHNFLDWIDATTAAVGLRFISADLRGFD